MDSDDPQDQDAVGETTIFCQGTEKYTIKKLNPPEENVDHGKEKSSDETEIDLDLDLDLQVCRICQDGQRESSLISPCACSGSCAVVHLKCLRLWLTTRKTDECEICQSAYKLKIVRVDRPFNEYFRRKRVVAVDGVKFIVFTILVLIALTFTVVYVTEFIFVHKDAVVASGISFLFFLVICVYSVWIYTTLKAHIFRWKRWKIRHQRVKLLPGDPENNNNNNNNIVNVNNSNNNNGESISMETERDVDSPSRRDFFVGLRNANTIIQINDAASAALLNYDHANQLPWPMFTFVNSCFNCDGQSESNFSTLSS